jgi:hypothetical protein
MSTLGPHPFCQVTSGMGQTGHGWKNLQQSGFMATAVTEVVTDRIGDFFLVFD